MFIVNRTGWLWSPANINGANKDAKIYVGRSTTVHHLLFCVHYTLHHLTQSTRSYWLVPRSVVDNYCVYCAVKAEKENKNIQKRTLSSFITILLYKLWCVLRTNQKSAVESVWEKYPKIAVRAMIVAPGEIKLQKQSDWQAARGNSGSWYMKGINKLTLARIHRFLWCAMTRVFVNH